MDKIESQMILKQFLEVSDIQIKNSEDKIKKAKYKLFLENILMLRGGVTLVSDKEQSLKTRLGIVKEYKDIVTGRRDSVALEMLDIISKNANMVSDKVLEIAGCSSVDELVEVKRLGIMRRGLYEKHPYTIAELLENLIIDKELPDFCEERETVTDTDVKNSVNSEKVIKMMIKTM